MLEQEKLVSQTVRHKILLTERVHEAIGRRDGSWFDLHGRAFDPSSNIYTITQVTPGGMPSLVQTRSIAAHYLGLAHYPPTFYKEHQDERPLPTEEDRQTYCEFIEFHLSLTGLLNLQEIQQIRNRGWWSMERMYNPPNLLLMDRPNLPDFQSVSDEIATWKKDGWKIALFHGAFDPVTLAHLQNATHAHSYSSVTGVPVKLVVGFDSDDLIKRKGKNRPRFPLDERRKQFGAFWMVDETVVLRAKKPDSDEFVQDYYDLGVDYVVLTTNEKDIKTRYGTILRSGLESLPIRESSLPNATRILREIRETRRKYPSLWLPD